MSVNMEELLTLVLVKKYVAQQKRLYAAAPAYLDELLDSGSLLELDLRDGSQGQQVLETVGDGVRRRGDGRVADGQREGGHVGHASLELGAQVLGLDVQDFWREDGARVVHLGGWD